MKIPPTLGASPTHLIPVLIPSFFFPIARKVLVRLQASQSLAAVAWRQCYFSRMAAT